MANYTVELKDVVNHGYNIFNFKYDFYDESKRVEFERDFIRHFYFREIGVDTIERFIFNLQDKMQTVFPYYNKLFEATKIDYSILDNYNLRETTTTERENVSGTDGKSKTVGSLTDDQSTENKEDRAEHRTEQGKGTSKNTRAESEDSSTKHNVESGTATDDTVYDNVKKDTNGTVKTDSDTLKKYLETPQGKLNLKDAKYLTNMGEDELDSTVTTDMHDSTFDKKVGHSRSNTDTNESTNVSTSGNTKDNGETTQDVVGDSTGNVKSAGTFKGEQKSTSDNNTRMDTKSNTSETVTVNRRGNIGIDTDADMIQKHIKLQQILTNIKKMFFDECEDLFMMVY